MASRFWRQAEYDLAAARTLIRPGTAYVAANLAHQAAEKALKAGCWHARGQEPPWGHLLRQLTDLAVATPEEIPVPVYQAVDRLQPIFGETRYPSGRASEPIPAELIGESIAREALESAEEVMAWVRTLLQRPPARA